MKKEGVFGRDDFYNQVERFSKIEAKVPKFQK
jgi:hypothetical protein